MPYDDPARDLPPLATPEDVKAVESKLAGKTNTGTTNALTLRVKALEDWKAAVVTQLAALQTHNHSALYSAVGHTHTGTPPDPTPTPTPDPTYGSRGYGVAKEPATTAGISATTLAAVASAAAGSTMLLRGGTYNGNLILPGGVTLKPYGGEIVRVNGTADLGSGSTLAGIHVEHASAPWVIHSTHRVDVTLRYCKIRGGTIEAIRIDGNSRNYQTLGCDLDGGLNNHVVKVYGEYGTPTDIIFRDDFFQRTMFTNPGEDLLQLQFFGKALVDHVTFGNNPNGEDQLDIKPGQDLTVTASLFDGVTNEAFMVAGPNQVINFDGNKVIGNVCSLGTGDGTDPTWDFKNNLLEGTILQIRKSTNAKVTNNTHIGGHVVLGTPAAGDKPVNVMFSNQHYQGTTFYANPGSTWTPANYGAV